MTDKLFYKLLSSKQRGRYEILVRYREEYIREQNALGFTIKYILDEIGKKGNVTLTLNGYYIALKKFKKDGEKDNSIKSEPIPTKKRKSNKIEETKFESFSSTSFTKS